MVCPRCGEANALGAKFCVQCGAEMPPDFAPPAGTPSVLGLSGAAAAPAPRPIQPTETSGKAIGSLICGVFFWIFPAAVGAIILGHLSLSDIRRAAGRLKGHGMAVAGLVLGYSGIFVIPFVLIIAAIAIPNLLRARIAANESSAVQSLWAIHTASVEYAATYGNGFAPDLATLDGAGTGAPSCDRARLINGILGSGERAGYTFTYTLRRGDVSEQTLSPRAAANGCSTPGASRFTLNADPVTPGTTGQRSFYIDQTGVVRWNGNGPAAADSPPLE
jgi:type II secretory pathway pseudopilin PulG